MAITISTKITDQVATDIATYCYLNEPLRVSVSEDDLEATKIYVDLQPFQAYNGIPIDTEVEYAEFDINPGESVSFDLMEIARQFHNDNIYRFGEVDSMLGDGYVAITCAYKYKFLIYSDITTTPVEIYKFPIIGGRSFSQFTPVVTQNSPINEFEYYGLDVDELKTRWGGTSIIDVVLNDPALSNVKPTISKVSTTGNHPCGGWLIWKSRFGGWMFWGFDIKIKKSNKRYEGMLDVGLFEADDSGSPFIPVDYTGISTSYSLDLKALSLVSDELLAVEGINNSPAVYYQEPDSEKIELMRVTSVSAPISSITNGGDFSVSLKSISKTSQKTI